MCDYYILADKDTFIVLNDLFLGDEYRFKEVNDKNLVMDDEFLIVLVASSSYVVEKIFSTEVNYYRFLAWKYLK